VGCSRARQGTLFGQNANGGAVNNIAAPNPTDSRIGNPRGLRPIPTRPSDASSGTLDENITARLALGGNTATMANQRDHGQPLCRKNRVDGRCRRLESIDRLKLSLIVMARKPVASSAAIFGYTISFRGVPYLSRPRGKTPFKIALTGQPVRPIGDAYPDQSCPLDAVRCAGLRYWDRKV